MNRICIHYLRELLGLILLFIKQFIPKRKFKILSIYFHNPSPKIFQDIINYLYDNSYRIISLEQLSDIIEKKKQLNSKIAIITVDDGWRDNLKLHDVILKFKVPITFFITTQAIEDGNFWFEYIIKNKNQSKASFIQEKIRIKKLDENSFNTEIKMLKSKTRLSRSALTKDEIIQLSRNPLITIGSHTTGHLSLPNCSYIYQVKELVDSKRILENWTNNEVKYFSYPSGDYSTELKILAKKNGYKLCFTTETDYININTIDKFSISRRCIDDDAGYFEALSKMFGLWDKVKILFSYGR